MNTVLNCRLREVIDNRDRRNERIVEKLRNLGFDITLEEVTAEAGGNVTARPHFARTVLALDADAPAAIGDALAGWHLEGWWAGGARAGRRAVKMADRLAIHLCDLDLTATPEARLEALDARLRGRESAPTLSDEAVVQERLDALTRDAVDQALTAGPGEGATVTPPGAQAIPPPPVVLECDLQVRERLRFLLWMRRIQSDELRAEIARPARVAHPGPARP